MNLAQLYSQAAGLHRAGASAAAERIYLQVLAAAPRHVPSLTMLGLLRHKQGRHTEALELLDTVMRHSPANPKVHYNRGHVLLALGRPAEALAAFEKALALDPAYEKAHFNRGEMLRRLDRHEEAVAAYDAALVLRPDSAASLFSRAAALARLERLEAALAGYRAGLALAPDHVEALLAQGDILQTLRRFHEALGAYDRALAVKPDCADGFNSPFYAGASVGGSGDWGLIGHKPGTNSVISAPTGGTSGAYQIAATKVSP